jgi:hypothetical protein
LSAYGNDATATPIGFTDKMPLCDGHSTLTQTMADELNSYGDHLIATTGTHGADIASQRLDDLDIRALRDILERGGRPCTAVDIGCGFGWQGVRFAMLGADVHLFDLLDEPLLVRTLREEFRLPLRYTSRDVTAIRAGDLPARIELGFSQRFVHYLRFGAATALMQRLASKMPAASKFYISASGIHSELGEEYPGRTLPVATRFVQISPRMQARHCILEPVCLYEEADLKALMTTAGFSVVDIWSSPFGNIKGVFSRTD